MTQKWCHMQERYWEKGPGHSILFSTCSLQFTPKVRPGLRRRATQRKGNIATHMDLFLKCNPKESRGSATCYLPWLFLCTGILHVPRAYLEKPGLLMNCLLIERDCSVRFPGAVSTSIRNNASLLQRPPTQASQGKLSRADKQSLLYNE